MSSAGRAVRSNGCVTKPKGRETGLRGCFVQIRSSLLTGSYVMETAEQREPYESRGSRTVLGEPGGESPPGHSTMEQKLLAGECFGAILLGAGGVGKTTAARQLLHRLT